MSVAGYFFWRNRKTRIDFQPEERLNAAVSAKNFTARNSFEYDGQTGTDYTSNVQPSRVYRFKQSLSGLAAYESLQPSRRHLGLHTTTSP